MVAREVCRAGMEFEVSGPQGALIGTHEQWDESPLLQVAEARFGENR